jgi:hypothetical protein
MVDFYSAHMIAREEHNARNRSLASEYAVSTRPPQPGWVVMQVANWLINLASVLTTLDTYRVRQRRSVVTTPLQSGLERQPGLD